MERQRWFALERSTVALSTLLPEVKLRQFGLEAKSLDAARMLEMSPQKRYTLAATLIELQNARVLDDLAEMFIKRMMRTHGHGREALAMDRLKHQERTDGLIHRLHEVLLAWGAEGNAGERLAAIDAALAPNSAVLLEQCEAHAAQAGNNYYPYLWRFYQGHRSTLLRNLAGSSISFNDTRAVPRNGTGSCPGQRRQPRRVATLAGIVVQSRLGA